MVKYIVRPNLSSLLFLRIIRKKRSNYGIAAVARGMFYGLSVVAARSLVGQARGISRSLKKAEEEGTLFSQKKRQTNTHWRKKKRAGELRLRSFWLCHVTITRYTYTGSIALADGIVKLLICVSFFFLPHKLHFGCNIFFLTTFCLVEYSIYGARVCLSV